MSNNTTASGETMNPFNKYARNKIVRLYRIQDYANECISVATRVREDAEKIENTKSISRGADTGIDIAKNRKMIDDAFMNLECAVYEYGAGGVLAGDVGHGDVFRYRLMVQEARLKTHTLCDPYEDPRAGSAALLAVILAIINRVVSEFTLETIKDEGVASALRIAFSIEKEIPPTFDL